MSFATILVYILGSSRLAIGIVMISIDLPLLNILKKKEHL